MKIPNSVLAKSLQTRLKMLFRSKTAIQIIFTRQLEKSNLSKAILQFENRVIFSALTQTISAIITLNATLSNAEQLIYFSVFETVLSNSIKGATKRPNIKLKASIPGSESLVGPRLRRKSRSKKSVICSIAVSIFHFFG